MKTLLFFLLPFIPVLLVYLQYSSSYLEKDPIDAFKKKSNGRVGGMYIGFLFCLPSIVSLMDPNFSLYKFSDDPAFRLIGLWPIGFFVSLFLYHRFLSRLYIMFPKQREVEGFWQVIKDSGQLIVYVLSVTAMGFCLIQIKFLQLI